MGFDKIFVLGAGAIGSVVGALLSKQNDVALVGDRQHVTTIRTRGLVICADREQILQVKADYQIHKIPSHSLIILTTKAYDTEKTIRRIDPLIKKDTTILVLQNGLGTEQIVKRAADFKPVVLRGITSIASEFFEPGKVRYWPGETVIQRGPAGKEIAEIFNESMLKAETTLDINTEVWNKTIINCVINPLTAILRVRNSEIASDSLTPVRRNIVEECTTVAESQNVHVSSSIGEQIDQYLMKYKNYSSMYQDIVKKKQTEIDFLNGRIVELGKENDIPTPVNQSLVSFVKFTEKKNELSN